MSRRLNWRTLIGHKNPLFSVKGHELAVALVGDQSRFALYEVRGAAEADGTWTTFYRLRDAHTVSDAQVAEGVRPRVVFESDDIEACLTFVDKAA